MQKLTKTRVLAVAGSSIAVAAIAGLLTAQTVMSEPRAERPEWVNADGTVNLDKMPSELPLVNEKGEVIGTAPLKRGPEPEKPSKPLMPAAPRAQR